MSESSRSPEGAAIHDEDLAPPAGLAELGLYTNRKFARNIEIYRRSGYAIDREETQPNGIAVPMRKATPAGGA